MKTCSLLRRFGLASGAFVLAMSAQAQVPVVAPSKPPPRLPPSATDTRIPAGVDTGSPTTSGSVPLGTPVSPTDSAERGEMKNRSAAARAAARPRLPAAPVDSLAPDRVPAGPAVLGVQTDSRNPAATPNATTAPGSRSVTTRPARTPGAARPASAPRPVKSSLADGEVGQVAFAGAGTTFL